MLYCHSCWAGAKSYTDSVLWTTWTTCSFVLSAAVRVHTSSLVTGCIKNEYKQTAVMCHRRQILHVGRSGPSAGRVHDVRRCVLFIYSYLDIMVTTCTIHEQQLWLHNVAWHSFTEQVSDWNVSVRDLSSSRSAESSWWCKRPYFSFVDFLNSSARLSSCWSLSIMKLVMSNLSWNIHR